MKRNRLTRTLALVILLATHPFLLLADSDQEVHALLEGTAEQARSKFPMAVDSVTTFYGARRDILESGVSFTCTA